MIEITHASGAFEREPLIAPFGFKGGYIDETWQTVARLQDSDGNHGLGLGVQSVLWSDADLFAAHPPETGNAFMFAVTEHALARAEGLCFETPFDLLDQLLDDAWDFAREISGKPDLRLTFVLNALVPVDAAAWTLYARRRGTEIFDDLVPPAYRAALACRHERLAVVPLFSYGSAIDDLGDMVSRGVLLPKIKIGADPDGDGDSEKMLRWDQERLRQVHERLKDMHTPWTDDGNVPYYFDANGRYDSKARLRQFLDEADRIGALDRILMIEEPFPEELRVDVRDLPVRLAADESAHSAADACERIEMGYSAITLKPVAKTMSMSLRILEAAYRAGVPTFCADLTVNPCMVTWNQLVAARLRPLPGLKLGIIESNGAQNYRHWRQMLAWHSQAAAGATVPRDGLYTLTDDFYAHSGGAFRDCPHYRQLF